jgi:hypothetical protein
MRSLIFILSLIVFFTGPALAGLDSTSVARPPITMNSEPTTTASDLLIWTAWEKNSTSCDARCAAIGRKCFSHEYQRTDFGGYCGDTRADMTRRCVCGY